VNWGRVRTVARTDLKQLIVSKDFWVPMGILGAFFFLLVPAVLLLSITHIGNNPAVGKIAQTLDVLPARAQASIKGDTDAGRAGYALAVFLFAPMAVVVPLTISTAVGAATIVGERERGTGEFLAHSPASTREIYLGKLFASMVPGYLTTLVGFGLYALLVNVVVGPEVPTVREVITFLHDEYGLPKPHFGVPFAMPARITQQHSSALASTLFLARAASPAFTSISVLPDSTALSQVLPMARPLPQLLPPTVTSTAPASGLAFSTITWALPSVNLHSTTWALSSLAVPMAATTYCLSPASLAS